jgi:hypothetical protein
MIATQEVQESSGQILFPLAELERGEGMPKVVRLPAEHQAVEDHNELNISGSQLLIASSTALGTVSLFLWAFLKLWLFD